MNQNHPSKRICLWLVSNSQTFVQVVLWALQFAKTRSLQTVPYSSLIKVDLLLKSYPIQHFSQTIRFTAVRYLHWYARKGNINGEGDMEMYLQWYVLLFRLQLLFSSLLFISIYLFIFLSFFFLLFLLLTMELDIFKDL